MKKGYYIYVENCGSSGVKKKIEMQIKAFSKYFDMKGIMVQNSSRTLLERLMGLLFWKSVEREYEVTLESLENPDFVYVRRTYVDRMYLDFLNNIKVRFPKCKIIVELPVYPYKGEMLSSLYTVFMYVKEVLYRHRYKENIDRFVTYSDDDEILGIPTIRTMNGVDVDAITALDSKVEYKRDEINLIAVAMLARHHGYERIIAGLYEYNKANPKRKVYFHIVGEGKELKKYKNLVEKYKLGKYVIFYGSKYGKELDEIYNIADAGVAAFGVYKEGFSNLNTIKTREYLAKGLPVILGAEDNLFTDMNSEYGLMFPNNSSVVGIDKIVTYLDNLYLNKGKRNVSKKIREYAYKNVDNEITLRPVVNYVNELENIEGR